MLDAGRVGVTCTGANCSGEMLVTRRAERLLCKSGPA